MVGLYMLLLLPLGLIAFLLTLLGLRKSMTLFVSTIGRLFGRMLIALVGCPIRVSGQEHIPRKGGVCFVSNHGSIFDAVLLLAYTGRPIGFIAKKEFSLVPLLNIWILLIGGLFVDRQSARKAVGTIHEGVRRLKDGGGMIIFPEGHRSRGQGLLPFRPGSFKLATMSEAPIVPVAITGSYDVFEREGIVRKSPVTVSFCAVVNTAEIPREERRQVLVTRTHEVIREAMEAAVPGSTGSSATTG
ncbi:MAG: 1-acyl-sn-glycerol-3-phosphate acyltransferase [Treponema sp.]|nr:1-acyl-sn-glycerol-3-phosphate acyltransferase [Treponema sp.]